MRKTIRHQLAKPATRWTIILVILLGLAASWFTRDASTSTHNTSKTAQTRVFTVTKKPIVERLFYSGNIEPLTVTSVSSPVPGIIKDLYFDYGQEVKKGELLMQITSEKLQEEYRDALTNFLKAKDQYLQSQSSFNGTELLYKNGIVSEEQFTRAKSQLESNQLAFITASNQLQKTGQKVPDLEVDATKLSLADIDRIKSLLELEFRELKVYAPADGIVLFPSGGSGSGNDNQAKTLRVGSEVKEGNVLLNIGDLNGITTVINVNELDVNRIKRGQKASVSSPALPGIKLEGIVSSVASQAKSQSSGQASFPTTIVVPEISTEARQQIRIGMEAKVELSFERPAELQIPINAVFQEDGVNKVRRLQADGTIKAVAVQTGPTNESEVVITSGLKQGDKVLVND